MRLSNIFDIKTTKFLYITKEIQLCTHRRDGVNLRNDYRLNGITEKPDTPGVFTVPNSVILCVLQIQFLSANKLVLYQKKDHLKSIMINFSAFLEKKYHFTAKNAPKIVDPGKKFCRENRANRARFLSSFRILFQKNWAKSGYF